VFVSEIGEEVKRGKGSQLEGIEVSRRLEVTSTSCRLRAWQRYWLTSWSVLWGAGAVLTLLPMMEASGITRAAIASVLGIGSYFFLESARSRVEFEEAGLVVLNGWRRHVIGWPAFSSFVLRSHWGKKVGYVDLLAGGSVRCLVLSTAGLVGGSADLEVAVGQMNEIATQLKSAYVD
jgi:hypothetical protein